MATTPGTPIAVDLRTPDVAAAQGFYGPLLGWEFADGTACVLDGAVVATLHPSAAGTAGWWVSFAVESTTTFAQDAAAAGGTVLDQPSDPPTVRVADPTGATFVVVDGADHDALAPGVGRASWFEIMTGDAAAADRFYAAVFAYDIIAPEGGTAESAPFALLRSGDRTIGGRLALPPELEQALGARWMVYFAVADVDAVADRAAELGGTVVVPPRDAPTGRVTALVDPGGAVFTAIVPRS